MRKLFRVIPILLVVAVILFTSIVAPIFAQDHIYDYECLPTNIRDVDEHGGVAYLNNGILIVANRGTIELWNLKDAKFEAAYPESTQYGVVEATQVDSYHYDGMFEGGEMEAVNAYVMYVNTHAGRVVIPYPERGEVVPFTTEDGFIEEESQYFVWHSGEVYQSSTDSIYIRWTAPLTNVIPSNQLSYARLGFSDIVQIEEDDLPEGAFVSAPRELLSNASIRYVWSADEWSVFPLEYAAVVGRTVEEIIVQTQGGIAACVEIEHEDTQD